MTSVENPFESFQSALQDLEKQCMQCSLRKKQADSKLNVVRQLIHRTHDDIIELESKIKESYGNCSSEIKKFNNLLFETRNIIATGTTISSLPSTSIPFHKLEIEINANKTFYNQVSKIAKSLHLDLDTAHTFSDRVRKLSILKKEIDDEIGSKLSFENDLQQRMKSLSLLENRKRMLEEEVEAVSSKVLNLKESKKRTFEKLKNVTSRLVFIKSKLDQSEKELSNSTIDSTELVVLSNQFVELFRIEVNNNCTEMDSFKVSELKNNYEQLSLTRDRVTSELETLREDTKKLEVEFRGCSTRYAKLLQKEKNLQMNVQNLSEELCKIRNLKQSLLDEKERISTDAEKMAETLQIEINKNYNINLSVQEQQKRLENIMKKYEDACEDLKRKKLELKAVKSEEMSFHEAIQKQREEIKQINSNIASPEEMLPNLMKKIELLEVNSVNHIPTTDILPNLEQLISDREKELKARNEEEKSDLEMHYKNILKETEDILNAQFEQYEHEMRQEEEEIKKKIIHFQEQLSWRKRKGRKRKGSKSTEMKEKRQKVSEAQNDFSIFDF